MEFDNYDPEKSKANKKKHGIDFEETKELWLSEPVRVSARTEAGEMRKAVIGQISGKIWTAIITERDGKIRIISCRRARKNEQDLYV